MCSNGGLAELEKWIHQNKSGLIARPGNRGNRVTAHLYNIINNNNINIIDSAKPPRETVTPVTLAGVTGVTGNDVVKETELPRLPLERALGNQGCPTKSDRLPRLPQLPLLEGEWDIDEEKVIAAQFLDWAESEIDEWPEGTKAALAKLQEWFQAKGYTAPADHILAFVTVFEFMRRKGGPVGLNPALAKLERIAKEVFGLDVVFNDVVHT